MLFGSRRDTAEEIEARIKREREEIEKKKKEIKEKRLFNLRKAREIRLLREKLAGMDKSELIEMIVELHKKNEKLVYNLSGKQHEIYEAEGRGYRQSGEDRYNNLSQAEKDNIRWERDRASDRLVN